MKCKYFLYPTLNGSDLLHEKSGGAGSYNIKIHNLRNVFDRSVDPSHRGSFKIDYLLLRRVPQPLVRGTIWSTHSVNCTKVLYGFVRKVRKGDEEYNRDGERGHFRKQRDVSLPEGDERRPQPGVVVDAHVIADR